MSRKEVESAVEKLLEPVLAENKIELVDVEYVRERNWVLRVFIDKEGGVDLNDCQEISEKAGAVLDEADVISDNYMLEVSSPGLDRVIKKDKDFIPVYRRRSGCKAVCSHRRNKRGESLYRYIRRIKRKRSGQVTSAG